MENEAGRRQKLQIRRRLLPNGLVELNDIGDEIVVSDTREINYENVGVDREGVSICYNGPECDECDERDKGLSENESLDDCDVDVGECDRIMENRCSDFEEYFGNIADEENSDVDSGNEFFDGDEVSYRSSSSEDEVDYIDDNKVSRARARSKNVGPDGLIALGKTYNSASDFKSNLLRYSLKTEYDIKMYVSSSKKVGAICSAKECPWRIYCSFDRSRNKLVVKVYINEHICDRSGYSKLLKTATIAELFEEDLRLKPTLTNMEMVNEIKHQYNMIVSPSQCTKAKKTVFMKRRAIHGEQFARLWDYQKELVSSNPGSTIDIETVPGPVEGQQRFFRIYLCFEALKTSWKQTCRRIIGLDGAFLKWDIKGELLAAIGRDGDNKIFPLAWAVVEVEDTNNWEWFIQHLKVDLEIDEGANLTIISDKQKVISEEILRSASLGTSRRTSSTTSQRDS